MANFPSQTHTDTPALDRPRCPLLDWLGREPVAPGPPPLFILLIFGEPRGGTGGGTLAFTMVVFFFSGGIAGAVEPPVLVPVPPLPAPGPPPLLLDVVVLAVYTLDSVSAVVNSVPRVSKSVSYR